MLLNKYLMNQNILSQIWRSEFSKLLKTDVTNRWMIDKVLLRKISQSYFVQYVCKSIFAPLIVRVGAYFRESGLHKHVINVLLISGGSR